MLRLYFWWQDRDEIRLDDRLEQLADPTAMSEGSTSRQRIASALPNLTKSFLPSGEKPRTRLQERLRHAGYYHPEAITRFLAAKMLLLVLPWPPALVLEEAGQSGGVIGRQGKANSEPAAEAAGGFKEPAILCFWIRHGGAEGRVLFGWGGEG